MIALEVEGLTAEEWQAGAAAALADGGLVARVAALLRRGGLLAEHEALEGRLVGSTLVMRVAPPRDRR